MHICRLMPLLIFYISIAVDASDNCITLVTDNKKLSIKRDIAIDQSITIKSMLAGATSDQTGPIAFHALTPETLTHMVGLMQQTDKQLQEKQTHPMIMKTLTGQLQQQPNKLPSLFRAARFLDMPLVLQALATIQKKLINMVGAAIHSNVPNLAGVFRPLDDNHMDNCQAMNFTEVLPKQNKLLITTNNQVFTYDLTTKEKESIACFDTKQIYTKRYNNMLLIDLPKTSFYCHLTTGKTVKTTALVQQTDDLLLLPCKDKIVVYDTSQDKMHHIPLSSDEKYHYDLLFKKPNTLLVCLVSKDISKYIVLDRAKGSIKCIKLKNARAWHNTELNKLLFVTQDKICVPDFKSGTMQEITLNLAQNEQISHLLTEGNDSILNSDEYIFIETNRRIIRCNLKTEKKFTFPLPLNKAHKERILSVKLHDNKVLFVSNERIMYFLLETQYLLEQGYFDTNNYGSVNAVFYGDNNKLLIQAKKALLYLDARTRSIQQVQYQFQPLEHVQRFIDKEDKMVILTTKNLIILNCSTKKIVFMVPLGKLTSPELSVFNNTLIFKQKISKPGTELSQDEIYLYDLTANKTKKITCDGRLSSNQTYQEHKQMILINTGKKLFACNKKTGKVIKLEPTLDSGELIYFMQLNYNSYLMLVSNKRAILCDVNKKCTIKQRNINLADDEFLQSLTWNHGNILITTNNRIFYWNISFIATLHELSFEQLIFLLKASQQWKEGKSFPVIEEEQYQYEALPNIFHLNKLFSFQAKTV